MAEQLDYDWPALVDDLNKCLRLKTTVTGMKMFERVEDMEAVKGVRRPKAKGQRQSTLLTRS